MNNFFIRNNLSLVQKICLGGLFIAILMILNKVIAINYISFIPFVRVSFGSGALICFASFLLGPLFGGAIGFFADVLGFLIFDPKTMGFFPQISCIYLIWGLIPYFIFCFVRKIKNKKVMQGIEYASFGLILSLIILFFIFNNSMKLYGRVYTFELWQKILIPSILAGLFIVLIVVNFILDKKTKVENNMPLGLNTYHISFVCFMSELIAYVILGSILKGWAFGFDMFVPILFTQGILLFLNVPLNTYLMLIIMRLTKKFYNE